MTGQNSLRGTRLSRCLTIMATLCCTAAVIPAVVVAHEAAPRAAAQPWLDKDRSSGERAILLVREMTLDEKIQLVHGFFPPLAKEGAPEGMIPSAGHIPGIPRLGIPTLRETDASLGVANQVEQRKGDVATALPSGLALAATFNPALSEKAGAMIGAEARAKRFNIMLAGGVNLTRDPWAGRNFEYLGEDPLLAGIMAGEAIKGIQSNRIVSTIKHFALNSQETGRMVMDARIDEASLRESDLLAFQIAIERGNPGSVMCAYNKVNGDYACENAFLLNKVLKEDWSYPGFVMSDWGAVHSTEKAALSGLDQQSGQELDKALYFGAPLKAAVEAGKVPMARLDDMVERILYGVIDAGVMDAPVVDTSQPIDYAAHAKVAQKAAEEGIVLLKNEGNMLPLAKAVKRIAVIGGNADKGVLSGGGSSQVRSVGGAPIEIPLTSGAAMSFARVTYHASSPLAALKKAFPNAEVSYVSGEDIAAAKEAAGKADVAIVFATQWQTEAQDTETIALPGNQDALIDAVAGANPKTAVILETGGPVLMPWIARVPAVIQAWYPGQRGGEAIARIIAGAVNPSGRLPITFPATAAQAPRPEVPGMAALKAADAAAATAAANPAATNTQVPGLQPFAVDYVEGSNAGYRWYAAKGHRPLFPFGHGLSYTSFRYANLKAEGGDRLLVSFDVTNTGKRAGADVPQLYVARKGGGDPARLAGWEKIALAPGETRRVTISAEPRILADYDVAKPGWVVAPGAYSVSISRDAATPALTGEVIMADRIMEP